jgi:beta-N-acetylhexosaminidase
MKNLGQLIMIGVEGTRVTPELELFIREMNPGGVILFGANYKSPRQISRFISSLCDAAENPLIVGVDQEGGRVARLGPPFTQLPPMASLGRFSSAKRKAAGVGRLLAWELAAVGINLDFAPVLDVGTNQFNPIIGDRAISADPEKVAQLGAALIQGLQREGVGACGKHFPGHGDTAVDSHLTLPLLPHTKKRLEACEFLPFRAAIDAGVASIMVGHLMVPNLDRDLPATFSRAIIRGILRGELGYDGLVFTDDLTMGGIEGFFPSHDMAWRAIAAGADMALVCHGRQTQRQALEGLKQAVGEGWINEAYVADALGRISAFQEEFCLSSNRPPMDVIGCTEHQQLAEELFRAIPPQRAAVAPSL